MKYDSAQDTINHRHEVAAALHRLVDDILNRAEQHDETKLHEPEKSYFDEYTPKLTHSTYMSDEYKSFLEGLKPALDHHYKHSAHHPEHYPDGISGMTLVDVIEMLADWYAASKRHADGDIIRSIKLNAKRFNYDSMFESVFINTVTTYFINQGK